MTEAKNNIPADEGIRKSIFGPKESQGIIKSLKERYPEETFTVLREFLKMEADERDKLVGEQNWADALNVVTPACCCLEEILKG